MAAGIDPLSILQALVGSRQNIDRNSTNNTANTGTQTGTNSSQQDQTRGQSTNTTGNTNTQQGGSSSGTNSSTSRTNTSGVNQQVNSGAGSVTGNQANQTTGLTQNVADVTALQDILRRQQSGPSSEQLQALFRVGSAGAPQLMSMYANAAGARTSNNAPAAVAMEGMMQKIMDQAAMLQTGSLNDAANTAARIAQLTSGQQTSGTSQGTTAQSSSQTNSQSGSQSSVSDQGQTGTQTQAFGQSTNQTSSQQQQVMETLRNLLTGNQSQTNSSSQQVNSSENTGNTTSIDDGRAMKLLGILAGGGMLNSGLTQAGLGGLSGLLGTAGQAAGGGIAGLLRGLGLGGTDWTGNLDQLFGPSSPDVQGGTDLGNMDRLIADLLGSGNLPIDLESMGIDPNYSDGQGDTNPFDMFPPEFWGDGGP
jgi:hypothetical protein